MRRSPTAAVHARAEGRLGGGGNWKGGGDNGAYHSGWAAQQRPLRRRRLGGGGTALELVAAAARGEVGDGLDAAQVGEKTRGRSGRRVQAAGGGRARAGEGSAGRDCLRRSLSEKVRREGSSKMKTQTMVSRSPCSKNKVFDSPAVENVPEIDPCYRIFLEHLREDGNSYVLDVPRGDHGLHVFVRYGEDHASYGDNVECGTKVPNSSLQRSQCSPNGKGPGVTSDKVANVNVGHPFSQGTSSVMKSSEVDESYATFLSLMKIKDGHMVIEPQPGVTIVYGQAEEAPAGSDELRIGTSTNERDSLMTGLENMEEENAINTEEDGLRKINNSTSEREMVGRASENMDSPDVVCTNKCGLVPYTELSNVKAHGDDQEEPLALSCDIPSTFDEKLNAVLSKPYDLNEYKELLRKATDRKPVSRQRHLRNASKAYATGAVGLSYLDYYPDLAIQIDSADCDKRKLCLLRKFFFWLENLCHEGAYMPWIDKPLACNPINADAYGTDSECSVEIVDDED